MQNRTLLIGLGALLAVLIFGGAFVYFARQPTQEVPAPGSEGTPEMVVEPSGEAREIEVSGDEYRFAPKQIAAKAGEKLRIKFTNNGTLPHNFTIAELGVATRTISPGQSETVEFTVEADTALTFYCSIGSHRALGMEGELTIE